MIPFPDKKYQVIYADPPWQQKRGPDWGSGKASKPLPYPTMPVEDIAALSVQTIADKNAVLFLWTTNKYIEQAYQVARAWGFKPSCLLTYCKPPHGIGIGGTFIQTSEHLLFCRRGTCRAKKRIDKTWFEQPRLTHSTKPSFFRNMIIEIFGNMSRIELFARTKTPGWDIWGNEVNIPQRPRLK